MDKKIELFICEEDEWQSLECDGECISENHKLDNDDWIALLNYIGYEVEKHYL